MLITSLSSGQRKATFLNKKIKIILKYCWKTSLHENFKLSLFKPTIPSELLHTEFESENFLNTSKWQEDKHHFGKITNEFIKLLLKEYPGILPEIIAF